MKVPALFLIFLLFACLPVVGQQEQPSGGAEEKSSAVVDLPKLPVPDLTTGADGKLSQEQMRQLLRVVADKDLENQKQERDYTFIDREVENKLDGKGQINFKQTTTYEMLEIYGTPVQRLIEKDDKPLDARQ